MGGGPYASSLGEITIHTGRPRKLGHGSGMMGATVDDINPALPIKRNIP